MKLLITIFICVKVCLGCNNDPCNDYEVLDDPTRSSNYFPSDRRFESDIVLDSGWYRNVNGAGPDMPTEYVGVGNCASASPIWLQVSDGQSLPEGQDEAQFTGCASRYVPEGSNPECVRTYENMRVRSCDGFRVYCLRPAIDSLDRYCFGTLEPCPSGESSPTGFQPGCGDPNVEPFANAPEINEYGWDFHWNHNSIDCEPYNKIACTVEHPTATFFYASWLTEGSYVTIPTEQNSENININDPAILTTADITNAGLTIGITVICRVRPRLELDSTPGSPSEFTFFIGAVPQQTVFNFVENTAPEYYVLDLTIPYIQKAPVYFSQEECDSIDQDAHLADDSSASRIYLAITTPTATADTNSCHEEDVLLEKDPSEDGCSIQQANRNQLRVKISPNSDGTFIPNRDIALQISTLPTNDGNQFWANYALPRVQVFIQDSEADTISGRICKASNDPHFTNFDQTRFEVQHSGYFVMYQHTRLPIRVEAYFKETSGSYTNVCGAAVRSGGEVWVFDECREEEPRYVKSYDCDSQDMDIDEVTHGYDIYLPTGTKVEVRSTVISIIASVSDYGQTEGLCGVLNRIGSDDFTHGDITDTSTPPDEFSLSWRIQEEDSLYLGRVQDDRVYNDVQFCSCTNNNNAAGASCSREPQLRKCLDSQHPLVTSKQKRCNSVARKKRSNIPGTDDEEEERTYFSYDPNFAPQPVGWGGEWTEERATTHCEDYMYGNDVIESCTSVPGVDVEEVIGECVQDIYLSGSTNYTSVHYNNILSACQTELERNIYPTENEDELVMQNLVLEALDQICENDCSGYGTCINGQCACEEGYTESDCSANENHVPDLYALSFSALCDKNSRPCEEFPVFGDLFILEQNITCKVALKDLSNNFIESHLEVYGDLVHSQKIMCPIGSDLFSRDYVALPYKVELSISNNGEDFSATKELIVYDSTCWECDIDTGCLQRDTTCVADGRCYETGDSDYNHECFICDGNSQSLELQSDNCFIHGDCFSDLNVNPLDESQLCDVSTNQHSWSVVSGHSTTAPQSTIASSLTESTPGMDSTVPGHITTTPHSTIASSFTESTPAVDEPNDGSTEHQTSIAATSATIDDSNAGDAGAQTTNQNKKSINQNALLSIAISIPVVVVVLVLGVVVIVCIVKTSKERGLRQQKQREQLYDAQSRSTSFYSMRPGTSEKMTRPEMSPELSTTKETFPQAAVGRTSMQSVKQSTSRFVGGSGMLVANVPPVSTTFTGSNLNHLNRAKECKPGSGPKATGQAHLQSSIVDRPKSTNRQNVIRPSSANRPMSGSSIKSNNSMIQPTFNRHGYATSSAFTTSLQDKY